MKGVNTSLTVVFGALLALTRTAVPALALTSISSCPANITQPGNYQLTADLVCTVSISASNVSLKLNGHIITPPNNADGIDVNVSGSERLNHVGIQGPGLITGASDGILIQNADYSQVSLVTIKDSNAGIYALSNSFLTVGSNVIGGAGAFGIDLLSCTSCVVSGNDTSGGSTGIVLNGAGAANTVNNNTTNGNNFVGINIAEGTGARVYGNVTNGNRAAGILVQTTGAQVFSNISALANGTDDLYDTSATCSGNLWSNDVFLTRNASCIH